MIRPPLSSPSVPTVVYLPRNYPVLSQTFVRNEISGLRDLGVDVAVLALDAGRADHVSVDWAGAYEVARPVSWLSSLVCSLRWLVTHPVRFLRLWLAVARTQGGGPRWTALRLLPAFAHKLSARNVTAVHTHFAFAHAWAALYLAKLLGVPASITVHAADIYLDTASAVTLLNEFDLVVNVCSYNESFLRDHGLTVGRTEIVPCGVTVPAEPSAETNGHSILSVGRLVTKKGFEGLLDAMPAVLASVPDATLDIIGDGDLEESLRRKVERLGLEHRVRLLGAQPNDVTLAAMETADLFVLNCAVPPDGNTDAMPVVIREAMARGRKVVTTAVAGIPETIDESSGWVVEPNDPAGLASAMIEALTSTDASERGRRARQVVSERYTTSVTANLMSQVLRVD